MIYSKPMRTPFVAANWKMHEPPVGAFVPESPYRSVEAIDIWVFPSFLDLHSARDHGLIVGAQCGRPDSQGAFTGDISMRMLADQRIQAVLCGHSERRLHHKEDDIMVAAQAIAALEAGLHPIVCIGETAQQRLEGKNKNIVRAQLEAIIPILTSSDLIIAYEPVWAISGGNADLPAATPSDAQEMHAYIRSLLPTERQEKIRIIYGGSAKPENALALCREPDVDGLLVGGASLDPASFGHIVEAVMDAKGIS